MITLVLEASTYAGSTALLVGGALVGERTVAMRGREHEALMPAVADLLAESRLAPSAVERVVCGGGPGSFTSLRIAGAIAKGIALAAACPLVPVSSLALLAGTLGEVEAGRYLLVVDALRGEHYAALFELGPGREPSIIGSMKLLPTAELTVAATSMGATLVGPDRADGIQAAPHARGAARLPRLLGDTPTADLAVWEPAYGRLAEAQVKWEAAHGRALESV